MQYEKGNNSKNKKLNKILSSLEIIEKDNNSNDYIYGITDAVEYEEERLKYKDWIDNKYHADLNYLERNKSLKFNPRKILPGCRSIILIGLNYWQPEQKVDSSEARVARYAWGRDYHKVLQGKLRKIVKKLKEEFPNHEFRNFVDSSPLLERFYASKAGLGFIGKNNLLINERFGSWFIIGEILSTKYFEAANNKNEAENKCENCTKCIDSCPTGALIQPFTIDVSKCISYHTIANKSSIPVNIRKKIGNNILGCDICQNVCPYNEDNIVTKEKDFLKAISGSAVNLYEMLKIKDAEEFRKKFAGSYLIDAGFENVIRNACVIAANNKFHDVMPVIKKLIKHENRIIAEHAEWAFEKLKKN